MFHRSSFHDRNIRSVRLILDTPTDTINDLVKVERDHSRRYGTTSLSRRSQSRNAFILGIFGQGYSECFLISKPVEFELHN